MWPYKYALYPGSQVAYPVCNARTSVTGLIEIDNVHAGTTRVALSAHDIPQVFSGDIGGATEKRQPLKDAFTEKHVLKAWEAVIHGPQNNVMWS
jgi:hypothetical protein